MMRLTVEGHQNQGPVLWIEIRAEIQLIYCKCRHMILCSCINSLIFWWGLDSNISMYRWWHFAHSPRHLCIWDPNSQPLLFRLCEYPTGSSRCNDPKWLTWVCPQIGYSEIGASSCFYNTNVSLKWQSKMARHPQFPVPSSLISFVFGALSRPTEKNTLSGWCFGTKKQNMIFP